MNKERKKEDITYILIIICLFLFHFCFLLISHYYHEKNDLSILTISKIETENKTNLLIQKKEIDDRFVNIVYETEIGTYKSYFVNRKTGDLLEIEDLIKPERMEFFQKKIKELIYLKYPKFIADGLVNEPAEIAYEVNDTELILHFTNFRINPAPTEELYLKVNYNEIKEDINFTAHLSEEYELENGYHYDKNKKTIALTFDDGPSGNNTLKLIETLKKNKMHATFFMVGNRMESYKDVVQNVLKYGNEIGSHSFSHANLTRLNKDEILTELDQTNQIYKNITGEDLKLLRPPYGNVNDIMKENLNYSFINWNIDTEDWRYKNVDHIYNAVIEKVEDGDIILMHDLYNSTVKAVEKLLPELYVRGFQVVTVTELANLKGVTLQPKTVITKIK